MKGERRPLVLFTYKNKRGDVYLYIFSIFIQMNRQSRFKKNIEDIKQFYSSHLKIYIMKRRKSSLTNKLVLRNTLFFDKN